MGISNSAQVIEWIKTGTSVKRLVGIFLYQQFEYWYDPCGKSGHDLDRTLTRISMLALNRIRAVGDLPQVDLSKVTVERIRRSDSVEALIAIVLMTTKGDVLSHSFAGAATTRLKNLIWHGEKTNTNPLDQMADALEFLE